MTEHPSFRRVTQSPQPLYGPRRLVICGFTPAGQTVLDEVLASTALTDLPTIYAATADLESALAALLTRASGSGRGEASHMPAAIIMAGITEDELHQLISHYRQAGLPRPLWATLTPTSEKWTLRQLLQELSAERAALQKTAATKERED